MLGLWIFLAFLLLFVILLLLPVGGGVRYAEHGFSLWLKVAFVRVTLYPRPKRKKKEKPEKRAKKEEPVPEEKKRGGSFKTFRETVSIVTSELPNLKRGIRVTNLSLYFRVSSKDDPAGAAFAYGSAWAALGILIPVLENNFTIKKRDVNGDVSFEDEGFTITASAEAVILVYRVLAIGIRVLRRFLKLRRKSRQDEPAKSGKPEQALSSS
ncbi:DUF2953 domain-containing protein [Oscillospiraceae bacterium OttesenSCG-928-G22]|nr:DUF2953 domain-containing protein [Oscillospiraceae bacterium OttesenSCG-928-G22]